MAAVCDARNGLQQDGTPLTSSFLPSLVAEGMVAGGDQAGPHRVVDR